MNRLDMTMEETQLMQSILRGYLATLDVEIDHADQRDFRKMLWERRHMVTHLLERCSTLVPEEERPADRAPVSRH